jgi:signal transduction histidine kinase
MIDNSIYVPLSLMACYLGLVLAMLFQRRLKSKVERNLLVYLLVSAAWNASFALSLAFPQNTLLTVVSSHAALGGLVILAVVFLNLTHAFLKQESRYTTAWWILGFVSLLIVVLLNPEVLSLGLTPWTFGRFVFGQREILQLFSIFAWAGFKLAAILVTWRVNRQTVGSVYRNRQRYWLLSLALLIVGDLLFATMLPAARLMGGVIKFVSALVAAQVILRSRLVDVKSVYRQAFGYITVTLMMIAVTLLIFGLTFRLMPGQIYGGALISVGITSLAFSFALFPVRTAVQRFVDRRLFHIDADYENALRKYGERVVQALRLESLAELLMDTLLSITHAQRGGLYLVQEGKREIGGHLFHLVKREGDLPAGDFELQPESLLVARLSGSDEPLMQYEIDENEDFADLASDERNWLRALAIEVLVPIRNQNTLVGLIALGAKGSKEAYSASDLEWLNALAAQTAVALENARLFDQVESMSVNVMRLNADLQRAYKQLQEVDRLKSAFIGVITHELRSPFVAAGFSIELLQRYVNEGMTDELQKQVDQLQKELGEGRRMIDNVISFASLLSKQGELKVEEIEVVDLLHTTLAPLQKMARSRSIDLTCACPSQSNSIRADKTRLAEAMYHLVHNAIKFNSAGGSVRVSCWPTDTHVVFKVEDTGQGIASEKLANIWEVFTQEVDHVKRGVEGLGLGLALVKFVVEAHHGEVWASSKPGEGSTFGFRIPKQLPVESPVAPG